MHVITTAQIQTATHIATTIQKSHWQVSDGLPTVNARSSRGMHFPFAASSASIIVLSIPILIEVIGPINANIMKNRIFCVPLH